MMMMSNSANPSNPLGSWLRYRKFLCAPEGLSMRLDVSRMPIEDADLVRMAPAIESALLAMDRLEKGATANADEGRMVGHYWLRAPELAPTPEIHDQIVGSLEALKRFVQDIHLGTIIPEKSDAFYVVLLVGIGGSALGPQFVCDALGTPDDAMMIRYLDNTDPDGMDRVLAELAEMLDETLTVVVSKSGGTTETRNAMLEVAQAYRQAGLNFARHAVAVTGEESALARKARDERWLKVFPIWDWVGGRTSVLSTAGLVPIALQGVDIDPLLAGAREADAATRVPDILKNPAALLALSWYLAGHGRGDRNMVVLPYCDRLALLGRYLQQLIMESIGKDVDRTGAAVHQGITVFGNKGSTDQHAYIQQLRDGRDDFFVNFIEVLRKRTGQSLEVEPDVTAADYLHGFLHGTRAALLERGRPSLTITLDELNPKNLGALIALYERTVGLYAELININAYHQPGVEAGKKAASTIVALQTQVLALMRSRKGTLMDAEGIARELDRTSETEQIHHLLEHLAAQPDRGIQKQSMGAATEARFGIATPMK